ncbi:CmcI family methyltransferase [Sphingomonas sp. NIBR02145]|uniref:CmcI family methyltransferase n=1 Tax=Sphingomonas sp. NIBR02145 TaxID=3014784 RepID=UPI0022B53FB6|nr:CmcI family methyltransferase [Sphingomonas sp. NIBR02145]WHU04029.1 CmcI family methyltransferase [Sphingomonas sp. NIBR02145]
MTTVNEPVTAPSPAAAAAGDGTGIFDPRPVALPDRSDVGAPACSVVMTAYNDFRFLDEAVDSVLGQDFQDFELIVIDDGSDDPEPVKALAARDPRIRVLLNETNVGTAVSANRAIAQARGDIIVRLDSDDVSEPSRIGKLVEALRADPELGLVGSAVTLIDEAGRAHRVEIMPETDLAIRWTLLFHNPFYHSATAFRRAAFEAAGGYREDEPVSQDHYLWFDILPHTRARNLAEPLTRYRVNSQGLTATHPTHSRKRTDPIREAIWRDLGLTYDPHKVQLGGDASNFLRGVDIREPERRDAAEAHILKMLDHLLAERPALARPNEQLAIDRFITKLRQRFAAGRRSTLVPHRLRRAWQLSRTIGVASTARLVIDRLSRKATPAAPRSVRLTNVGEMDPVTALFHQVSPYEGFDPSAWPADVQGWGSEDPVFLEVMSKVKPKLIVEVGSWKGASAIHMARMAKALRLDCRIICVDTWLGSPEHALGQRPEWRESLQFRHGFPQLYFTFLANVVRAGVADRIVPLANSSDNAALILAARNVAPDLIYIDGAHEEDPVYRDLHNYWRLLAPGGALIGDDFGWEGVRRAAERFAAETGLEIDARGEKFILWRAQGE